MAKLTASKRASLPKKDFAGPDRSYPVPDKSHAVAAKGFAARFASPGERSKIDAKANRVIKGGGGMSKAKDARLDKKMGIKPGSAADKRMDAKNGVRGGGGKKGRY